MEQMPPIPAVPLPPTTVQAILELVVLRDRMDMIVDHLKWIKKFVCVHICYIVCNTNEVHYQKTVIGCTLSAAVPLEPLSDHISTVVQDLESLLISDQLMRSSSSFEMLLYLHQQWFETRTTLVWIPKLSAAVLNQNRC
jgi:hypothetical protein